MLKNGMDDWQSRYLYYAACTLEGKTLPARLCQPTFPRWGRLVFAACPVGFDGIPRQVRMPPQFGEINPEFFK